MSRIRINWDEYTFRCSQLHYLDVGTIGTSDTQDQRIAELIQERDTGININGNKCKWTDPKKKELERLEKLRDLPWHEQLPQTMKTELRKIHRSERYNRNFPFTNKYVKKGLAQEQEATTTLQLYRENILGIKTFINQNEERIHGEYWSGVPDIRPISIHSGEYKGHKIGFDTKCSWDLSTFPYREDPLDARYENQNQGYMDLEDVDIWITAYVLVNATEVQVNNEKLKWYYSFQTNAGLPDTPDHPFYEDYIQKCKEVERMMIFDYDRFKFLNPGHLLEHSPEEWHESLNPKTGLRGYDIPLEDRVIEKYSFRSQDWKDNMIDRILYSRRYLNHLETL